MDNFTKLTESELDGLLELYFHPNSPRKFNFNTHEAFKSIVLEKIKLLQLTAQFGDNISNLLAYKQRPKLYEVICDVVYLDLRSLKIAALQTARDNKEKFRV